MTEKIEGIRSMSILGSRERPNWSHITTSAGLSPKSSSSASLASTLDIAWPAYPHSLQISVIQYLSKHLGLQHNHKFHLRRHSYRSSANRCDNRSRHCPSAHASVDQKVKDELARQYIILIDILAIIFEGLLQINQIYVLLVCRIFQGIFVGYYMSIVPIYIN